MISVICASKNEERDVLDLCRSFVSQTFPAKELVFVDDSTDNTREVIGEFIHNHPDCNIQVLHGHGDGCCPARNLGVENSRGEIICYMTADSFFPDPNYLSHVNAIFESGLDAYMPNGLVANQDELYADFLHCWGQNKLRLRGNGFSPLTAQGYCVRKSAALSVGLIDTIEAHKIPYNVCRDWTLIKKMDQKGFAKKFDKSMLVKHTAPGDFKDFLWTHIQRGSMSGGYNRYFRKKRKLRLFFEASAKSLRSLLFYFSIVLPLRRAIILRAYSSHKRGLLQFLWCDLVKTFAFHYGEFRVLFRRNS